MRAAVLSDVHGNVRALEAVLNDLPAVDVIVANGDLLAYGPRPADCLTLLQEMDGILFVRGNNDRNLLERRWERPPADGWEQEAFENLRWTAADVGAEGLSFVATWPFHQVLPMTPSVCVVHASPAGDSIGMFPWTPDADLERLTSGVSESVLVCGHTHLLMDRKVGDRRIISDGSAGFPFDRDVRPSYLVLDDSSGQLAVEVRRVAYDYDGAIEDLMVRATPFAQVIAYQVRYAALMPKHETDYARRDLLRFAE